MEYDFEYYKVDMAADISVLVLSDARSRLLPADMTINIKPISAPMLMSADEPELSMWRQYLSAARYMEHSVPAGVQKVRRHYHHHHHSFGDFPSQSPNFPMP